MQLFFPSFVPLAIQGSQLRMFDNPAVSAASFFLLKTAPETHLKSTFFSPVCAIICLCQGPPFWPGKRRPPTHQVASLDQPSTQSKNFQASGRICGPDGSLVTCPSNLKKLETDSLPTLMNASPFTLKESAGILPIFRQINGLQLSQKKTPTPE